MSAQTDKTEIIQVDAANLEKSHICCALGSTADAKASTKTKKEWMASVFDHGYQFHRLNDQGKVFIETIPGENAWCPLSAEGWLFIDCFWVSGKFKGQGLASRLLDVAVQRAQKEGLHGLCALSSKKKQPFLSDAGFYLHKGFTVADTAPPYYQLMALPLNTGVPLPHFLDSAKIGTVSQQGACLWYSKHCPHTSKYAGLLADVAQKQGVPFTALLVDDKAKAQSAPNPFPTWALFWNGAFVTNEIFSPAKFEKFLAENNK